MERILTIRKWSKAGVCACCRVKKSGDGFWADIIETVAGDVIDDTDGSLPMRCHACEMQRLHEARRQAEAISAAIKRAERKAAASMPLFTPQEVEQVDCKC